MDQLPTITLSMLSWNTKVPTLEAAEQMLKEAEHLRSLGEQVEMIWVDNGSDDGTAAALVALGKDGVCVILNETNLGNSVARNQIIDHTNSEYLLLTDGDLELVSGSAAAMLECMRKRPDLGVLGASSASQTRWRQHASRRYDKVTKTRDTGDLVAWTQYGLFRTAMFKQGVRFCEEGAFGKAGWGYEDNDLQMQISVLGCWRNEYFEDMVYLHRNRQSSCTNLAAKNIDPAKLYQERKQLFMKRWAKHPLFAAVKQYYDIASFPEEWRDVPAVVAEPIPVPPRKQLFCS